MDSWTATESGPRLSSSADSLVPNFGTCLHWRHWIRSCDQGLSDHDLWKQNYARSLLWKSRIHHIAQRTFGSRTCQMGQESTTVTKQPHSSYLTFTLRIHSTLISCVCLSVMSDVISSCALCLQCLLYPLTFIPSSCLPYSFPFCACWAVNSFASFPLQSTKFRNLLDLIYSFVICCLDSSLLHLLVPLTSWIQSEIIINLIFFFQRFLPLLENAFCVSISFWLVKFACSVLSGAVLNCLIPFILLLTVSVDQDHQPARTRGKGNNSKSHWEDQEKIQESQRRKESERDRDKGNEIDEGESELKNGVATIEKMRQNEERRLKEMFNRSSATKQGQEEKQTHANKISIKQELKWSQTSSNRSQNEEYRDREWMPPEIRNSWIYTDYG